MRGSPQWPVRGNWEDVVCTQVTITASVFTITSVFTFQVTSVFITERWNPPNRALKTTQDCTFEQTSRDNPTNSQSLRSRLQKHTFLTPPQHNLTPVSDTARPDCPLSSPRVPRHQTPPGRTVLSPLLPRIP